MDASTERHAMHLKLNIGRVQLSFSETLTHIYGNTSFYKKYLAGGREHGTSRNTSQVARRTWPAVLLRNSYVHRRKYFILQKISSRWARARHGTQCTSSCTSDVSSFPSQKPLRTYNEMLHSTKTSSMWMRARSSFPK